MRIIQASVDQLDLVTPLFNAYRMFYEQPSNLEGARQFIEERIQKEESIIFLALEGEDPVGFTQLYPTFSSVGMKRGYILNDLYVDVQYRKQGVGRALLEIVFKFCEEQNAKFVQLETAPDNFKAKGLYEQMGMQLSNEYDSYVKGF